MAGPPLPSGRQGSGVPHPRPGDAEQAEADAGSTDEGPASRRERTIMNRRRVILKAESFCFKLFTFISTKCLPNMLYIFGPVFSYIFGPVFSYILHFVILQRR